jgi:hypothetical protein
MISLEKARFSLPLLIASAILTACGADDIAPQPQTEPVEEQTQPAPTTTSAETAEERVYALDERFTVAWAEMSEPPEDVNLTITVTWRCGNKTKADIQRAADAAKETYGELADPAPDVAVGYQLCVASLKVSNTGKKHLQHSPVTTALDSSDVEYNQDDELTSYIGHGATFKEP